MPEKRPSVFLHFTFEDVGLGALLFFTSHMVIRIMYLIGTGCSQDDLVVLFAVVVAALLLAHLASPFLIRLRLLAAEYFDVPVVSMLATAGIALMLIFCMPSAGIAFLFVGGFLVGFSCGWAVSIWLTTHHVRDPSPSLFKASPALVVAVLAYLCFRLLSSVSEAMGDGLMMALPLIAIACILCRSPRKGTGSGESSETGLSGGGGKSEGGHSKDGEKPKGRHSDAGEESENRRALLALVAAAATFAFAGGVVAHLSGKPILPMSAEISFQVVYELIAAALMLGICRLLFRFATRMDFPPWTGAFVFALLCIPLFSVGLLIGLIDLPNASSGVLWECSLWVLVIAVFAYDMRTSPYAVNGLGVALLFEALVVGQMLSRLMLLAGFASPAVALCVGFGLVFFVGVGFQLLGGRCHGDRAPRAAHGSPVHADPKGPGAPGSAALDTGVIERYRLTLRELEILDLLAHGRSVKYVAEELTISYHTARTHARHIYEKLNIHSKQELIDFVELLGRQPL
ncbi:MAG: helix-turn-helix transcriptional regulator [Coriobacteriales bacterium]|jgi:DNA-binding CsgD family transcriptional regulator|nr:helix-turn-helix transcriptional regulator [Coriobacteriales bacterium]